MIQFLASLAAVGALVALAGWAKIERDAPPLDEGRARALLADDFPELEPETVWVSDDGGHALARCGDALLDVRRLGDGYVTSKERFRPEAWPGAAAAGSAPA